MKISIITVSFNSASTIQKTFNSVKNQTYFDIEYIVVDGNSTDGTQNIIKHNQDFIDKWISETDQGLYDAMNKGIKMATGDIIGILNSDDAFYDHRVLEKIADFHLQNDIQASVGNITQYNKNGKHTRTYSSRFWKPEKLKIGFMPPHPSIFFNKELFEKFGYYKLNFVIGSDYELITRFFLKNKIKWKYSRVTTTSMLVGGLSSSGMKSYKLITKEIQKTLKMNDIKFNPLTIEMRFVWKIIGLIRKENG